MILGRLIEFREPCKQMSVNTSKYYANFLRTDKFKHNCLVHTIDLSGKAQNKSEGQTQIQGTRTKLASPAGFWHPTRINKAYKLSVNVCHRSHASIPKNIQGTEGTWGKRPSAFLREPLSQLPKVCSPYTILLTVFQQTGDRFRKMN